MYEIRQRVLDEVPTAVVRRQLEITEVDAWIAPILDEVAAAVTAAGSHPDGPPFARLLPVDDTAARFDVEVGFAVTVPVPSVPGADVQPSRLPGGPAVTTVHEGSYEALTPAYEALAKWIADSGAVPDGSGWEVYLSPPVGDSDDWCIEVVQPYTTL